MTNAKLIRHSDTSTKRACLHAAMATMQSGFRTFVAGRRKGDGVASFGWALHRAVHDEATPGPLVDISRGRTWTTVIFAALATVAGIVALDLLVLWVAAERVIEHLPF